MTETWITIEQAAVALNLSVRTVNRHIAAGKLQSRLQDGRREVLIDASAASTAVPTRENAEILIGEQVADIDGPVDYDTVLALADSAADKAELAVSAYQTLARSADERVRSTRRQSTLAWSLVAALAVATVVSVGWASHTLTRATVEAEHLRSEALVAAKSADAATTECDDLRRALADARERVAHSEGKLAAYSEPRPSEPSTRPSLADAIASIFQE